MTMQTAVEPVRTSVTVEAPIERAFEVFTEGFDSWWPRENHNLGAQPLQRAVLEPREGGRWYEIDANGDECDWGSVLAYEPPNRVVVSWQIDGNFQLDGDPERASEVEVRFTAEGDERTRVELEHRHLERHGDTAQALRVGVSSEGGWPGLLEDYARRVAA
jgi:uncharacterized protein YndB with AHSA1/START domain